MNNVLKQYKIDNKITTQVLANKIGLTQGRVFNLFKYNVEDFKNIPLDTVIKIKENLGIDLVEYYKNNKKGYDSSIKV